MEVKVGVLVGGRGVQVAVGGGVGGIGVSVAAGLGVLLGVGVGLASPAQPVKGTSVSIKPINIIIEANICRHRRCGACIIVVETSM